MAQILTTGHQHTHQPQDVKLINKVTSDNILRVALDKADTNRQTFITHNWADKTTWYTSAVRVVDEVATNSGDNQQYTLANPCVIDTYHGKITQEDFLADSDGYSYRVAVKVNDVAKTEQDPHYGTGGDYTVDYVDGYIDFLSALNPADEVKVTYHYATNSKFYVRPRPGKMVKIDVVEIQFSEDIGITDTVSHQAYGNVEAFAPQLSPSPYPAGTPIPLDNPTKFKTLQDYMNDAIKSYPKYPALSASTWRGITSPSIVMDWDYRAAIVLHDTMGMYIEVSLDHDEPFTGTYATATFYCKEEDCDPVPA
jgi:hypothetical protein